MTDWFDRSLDRPTLSGPDVDMGLLAAIRVQAFFASEWERAKLLDDPRIPPDLRHYVANSEVDEEILTAMKARAFLGSQYERRGLAQDPRTPEKVLQKLLDDDDYRTRKDVAARITAPHILLGYLGTEEKSEVRQAIYARLVALLPEAEADAVALRTLSHADRDTAGLAARLASPSVVAAALAGNFSDDVKVRILEIGKNVTRTTLEPFLEGANAALRVAARERMDPELKWARLYKDKDFFAVREAVLNTRSKALLKRATRNHRFRRQREYLSYPSISATAKSRLKQFKQQELS